MLINDLHIRVIMKFDRGASRMF